MRASRLFACVLVMAPGVAAAEGTRFTAGVDLGLTQSSKDADNGSDASHTLGLYGRVQLSSRLSGQLELGKIDTDDDTLAIRQISALVVVDLANGGHWMPILLAGIGYDHAETDYGATTDAHHIEGGFGLEYRADGGFVAGIDLRLGGRTIDSDTTAVPLSGAGGGRALFVPVTNLTDGEYRSARLYAGVHF
ncbi:MAG TPA: outer membrane beta-barrel protein [Kofleriaceae bacterium]|nr:outer membrane beta-barrel protein [Kofleriaceae bacterium]